MDVINYNEIVNLGLVAISAATVGIDLNATVNLA